MTSERARDYLELFAERAAIREYNGGLDRDWAEIFAWAEMPPDDGGLWLRYIDPAPSQKQRPPPVATSRVCSFDD